MMTRRQANIGLVATASMVASKSLERRALV
jgi:hypothetical protein